MRTTRVAEVSTEIDTEDASGKDPLPKRIAKATICFTGREVVELGNRLLGDTKIASKGSGFITTVEEA